MRKVLLTVIIVLLLVLIYNILTNGITIGSFQTFSIEQIKEKSQELKTKIEQTNIKIDSEYPNALNDLNVASKNMKNARDEYLRYSSLSSEADILEARTEKSYAIEFLWTKLGYHARENGVILTFQIASSGIGANSTNDIKFTVNGSYIAITNFIYSIENDTDLDFRIQDFKMLPYQDEILQATFTVTNITVEGNTSSQKTITQDEDSNDQSLINNNADNNR